MSVQDRAGVFLLVHSTMRIRKVFNIARPRRPEFLSAPLDNTKFHRFYILPLELRSFCKNCTNCWV